MIVAYNILLYNIEELNSFLILIKVFCDSRCLGEKNANILYVYFCLKYLLILLVLKDLIE